MARLFSQVAPPGTVHLGVSICAMVWLSSPPAGGAKGGICHLDGAHPERRGGLCVNPLWLTLRCSRRCLVRSVAMDARVHGCVEPHSACPLSCHMVGCELQPTNQA